MISSHHLHAVMRHDDSWRDIPVEKRILTSMRGLPDILPLATNGILVLGRFNDGREYLGHLENMIKPEQFSRRTPSSAKARKPSKKALAESKEKEIFDALMNELFQ